MSSREKLSTSFFNDISKRNSHKNNDKNAIILKWFQSIILRMSDRNKSLRFLNKISKTIQEIRKEIKGGYEKHLKINSDSRSNFNNPNFIEALKNNIVKDFKNLYKDIKTLRQRKQLIESSMETPKYCN